MPHCYTAGCDERFPLFVARDAFYIPFEKVLLREAYAELS
jgi:hypothetical protein